MGRVATDIAAAATMADNLPQRLPRVSFLDALLPRSVTSPSKPLGDPNASARSGAGDYEVRKNKRGKLSMVYHKGSSSHAGSAAGFADGKDGEKIMTQDVKKNKGGNGKKNQAQTENQDQADGEKQEGDFTAEEDAKLTEFKTDSKGISWVKISEEMGRSVEELKNRWNTVLKPGANGNAGGQENGNKGDQGGKGKGGQQNNKASGGDGGNQKTGNDNSNKGANNQQGGGKKGKGKAKDWTAEDDAKLKELWVKDTAWAEMQKELKCGRDVIQARWDEIGDKKEPAKNQGSNDQKAGPNHEFTDDEDKQLKELKASGATDRTIAKQMKKPKLAIEARWKEIGDDKVGKPDDKPAEPKDTASKGESKKAASVKAASVKAGSNVSKARSHRSEARFTMGEWMTLQEDELFTFQELQLLSHIIMRDPSQSWLRVASSFHDKTGRRVHPDDIREKFEVMAAMN